jgi:hypothetical protein
MTARTCALGVWLLLAGAARGQEAPAEPRPAEDAPSAAPVAAPPARIQWYATWTAAKAEAARLQRPLLLQSAAPQCHGISGLW